MGIRNALIEDLRFPQYRNDMGALWKNFVIAERMKLLRYLYGYGSLYFWRTQTGAEVDLIEERDGQLIGYECKWNKNNAKPLRSFLEAYPQATFVTINPQNFTDYLTLT